MRIKEVPTLDAETVEQFWSKVPDRPEDGCWIWKGTLSRNGYGRFPLNKSPYLAHRVAYVLIKGNIPPGTELDHTCHTPSCVRPDHLEPVTRSEHSYRRYRRDGCIPYQLQRPTCPKGHEYTSIATDGARRCTTCEMIQRREARLAQGKKPRKKRREVHVVKSTS